MISSGTRKYPMYPGYGRLRPWARRGRPAAVQAAGARPTAAAPALRPSARGRRPGPRGIRTRLLRSRNAKAREALLRCSYSVCVR
eukprot:1848623-Pleurochrysis_carterae.AAC.1